MFLAIACADTTSAQSAIVFRSDAGVVINAIKPKKADDFQKLMQRVRHAMLRSGNTKRQEQAKSWKIYRAQEPFDGNTVFLFVMDPVVAGVDYEFVPMLRDVMSEKDTFQLMRRIVDFYAAPRTMLTLTRNFVPSVAAAGVPASTLVTRSLSWPGDGSGLSARARLQVDRGRRSWTWSGAIHNTGHVSRTIVLTVLFSDAAGPVVDLGPSEMISIAPGEERIFSGAKVLGADAAERVTTLLLIITDRC